MMSALLDSAVFPGIQGGPLEHVIAAKAVAFGECLQPEYKAYQAQVKKNAAAMAAAFIDKGYKVVSGGTDNHLMLVDVTVKGTTGKQAEQALDVAGITVNKNMIPYDPRKPMDPSGIRIGTPALTTRGMGIDEMKRIGGWILEILKSPEDEALAGRIRGEVKQLCESFPVPAARLAVVQ